MNAHGALRLSGTLFIKRRASDPRERLDCDGTLIFHGTV
jgi:hypothetical protein